MAASLKQHMVPMPHRPQQPELCAQHVCDSPEDRIVVLTQGLEYMLNLQGPMQLSDNDESD